MNTVIRYFESEDGNRRVEIYRRPNGTFGFEDWRRDLSEAGAWVPAGRYSHGIFDSEQTASREARDRIEWFQPPGYRLLPRADSLAAADVAVLVRGEIGDDWSHTNLHGCDLRTCLVQPELIPFTDATGQGVLEAWLVLRDDPSGGPGYGVCYHAQSGEFGLVQFAPGFQPDLIGTYGGLFDAFDAM